MQSPGYETGPPEVAALQRPRRDQGRLLALVLAFLCFTAPALAEDRRTTTVGMPAPIDQLVLPGSELEAKPLADERTPIVLRIVNIYPHNTAHRYDLVYYGLDPGKFDLRDYLRRVDGTSTADLPALPVTIEPVLPPGQVQPHALELTGSPFLGGYRLALVIAGVLWVVGLVAILLVGREKKRAIEAAQARPLTVADRLRPLVERAMEGRLSQGQRAELERTLLAFWRKQLRLEDASPADAMARLRAHPQAGRLLEQLEVWFHRPPGNGAPIDVESLLQPYRGALDGALTEPEVVGGRGE
jgi:hypothetical protein